MKTKRLPLIMIFALLVITGCSSLPKHMTTTTRIEAPPPGKALVNFHRPTGYGKMVLYPIFDGEGKFICDIRGNSVFQYVCDPGQHVFMGWADHVSVVEAQVAADKIYDIMVDVGMGWVQANIRMEPLVQGDERRKELADFERREKFVLAIQDTEHVRDYQDRNLGRVQEIKRDFLEGEKSDRVRHLSPEDSR